MGLRASLFTKVFAFLHTRILSPAIRWCVRRSTAGQALHAQLFTLPSGLSHVEAAVRSAWLTPADSNEASAQAGASCQPSHVLHRLHGRVDRSPTPHAHPLPQLTICSSPQAASGSARAAGGSARRLLRTLRPLSWRTPVRTPSARRPSGGLETCSRSRTTVLWRAGSRIRGASWRRLGATARPCRARAPAAAHGRVLVHVTLAGRARTTCTCECAELSFHVAELVYLGPLMVVPATEGRSSPTRVLRVSAAVACVSGPVIFQISR